jgi:hypothetical protein
MSEVDVSPCVVVTHHLILLASEVYICGYGRWKCYMRHRIHLAFVYLLIVCRCFLYPITAAMWPLVRNSQP